MLPESLLAQLKHLLAEQTGLNFFGSGWCDFELRINAAAREAGVQDATRYITQLLSAPLAPSQIELLARHLTVGETYFFREKHSFDALADQVLPELLRSRESAGRRLRIWSAGCCTGEEAYSIAILLDRLLPCQEGWDISITATDINPDFLQTAQQGLYHEWSFRGTPDWVREEYFKKKKNGSFELLPKIRKRVQFSYLNLADNSYPSSLNNTDCLDAIFCRNVLMYFTREQASRIIARFHAALHTDGILSVSPAETSTTLFSDFTSVNYPGSVFYRTRAYSIPKIIPPPHSFSPEIMPMPAPGRGKSRSARAVTRHVPLPDNTEDANQFARNARQCADTGDLNEAAKWCAQAIAANKLNPAFHYLLASIEQERGMYQAAIQALQSTLYLEQDFVLAHFSLANLRLAEGRSKDAVRHLTILRKLLKKRAPEEVLPDSDGLTVAGLDDIVATLETNLIQSRSNAAVSR